MAKQMAIEFNAAYEPPQFNKKWFIRISKAEYESKLKTNTVSGKPTKVWKDIARRFFTNKWNLVFLGIIIVIAFFLAFGDLFTSFADNKPVRNVDRSLVQFLRPEWDQKLSEYTGRLTDIQNNIDAAIKYVPAPNGTGGHLEGPNGMVVTSTFTSSGLWTIKYHDPGYIGTALGTDSSGVSVYSRLVTSARYSIGLALLVATIEMVIGTVLGIYLGYNAGKRFDTYTMRFIEMFYSIPALLVVILVVLVMGSGFGPLLFSLVVIGWVAPTYVARMFTIKIKDAEFIKASKVIGASDHAIIFKHVLPNIIGRLLVSFVNRIPIVIFTESILVFLGIAVGGEARNSLGNMFQEARTIQSIEANPWFLASTTIMLASFALSMQIISNGVRDAFDAKIGG